MTHKLFLWALQDKTFFSLPPLYTRRKNKTKATNLFILKLFLDALMISFIFLRFQQKFDKMILIQARQKITVKPLSEFQFSYRESFRKHLKSLE